MSITSTVSNIGPQEAQAILDAAKTFSNRPVSPSNLAFLTQQILRGEWRVNGEPIILDENGVLLDGQHRLLAIIAAGKAIDIVVTRGVKKDVFPTIDTGKKRDPATTLALAGFTNTRRFAAGLRWVQTFLDGLTDSGSVIATCMEIRRLAIKIKDFPESLSVIGSAGNLGFTRGAFYFLHWATTRAHSRLAADFWSKALSGEDIRQGDPAFAFRDKVLKNQTAHTKRTERELLAIGVKCWNAHVNGEQISRPQFAFDEEFPKIAGFDISCAR